jgi:hypothetical protein
MNKTMNPIVALGAAAGPNRLTGAAMDRSHSVHPASHAVTATITSGLRPAKISIRVAPSFPIVRRTRIVDMQR